jgi:hypothetical protein
MDIQCCHHLPARGGCRDWIILPFVEILMNGKMWAILLLTILGLSALASTNRADPPNGSHFNVPKPTTAGVVIEPVATIDPGWAILVEEPQIQGNLVSVHYSHYTPWTGGTNCSNFQNGVCISNTASGEPWQNWLESGVACIKEWSFFKTKINAFGQIWTCVDRGGKIRYDDFRYFDGLPWIDFLTANPQAKYGEIITVEVINE